MSDHPDFERLYHLQNKRRGEELHKLQRLLMSAFDLRNALKETDRQVERCYIGGEEEGEEE